MSATIRRLRKERVDADTAALRAAEANLDEALARRAEAQQILDDATREAAVLDDIRDLMAGRLEASRAELLRICVSAIPDDILRCIFEVVCMSEDHQAPFSLAAVCPRWRKVALSFSPIWSSIYSVPASQSQAAADYSRILTLLSRSGVAPLNIGIYWGMIQDAAPHEFIDTLNKTLSAICAHASRWRIALFVLTELADLSVLDCLKGPTPLLTELIFSVRSPGRDIVHHLERSYLPFAPILRRLIIGRTGIHCSPHAAFPKATKLRLGEGVTEEGAYDCLMRSPSLVSLELNCTITAAPQARICLPDLKSLDLASKAQRLLFEPSSSFLVTPRLEHLSLACTAEDAMIPFLDAVSATVLTLDLWLPLTAHQLSILRHLQNIETLSLNHVTSRSIDGFALEQLASSDPPIWPRLSSLERVEHEDGLAEHVLRLIVARNTPPSTNSRGASPDPPPPSKLREVTFRGVAPSWLMQEVERLLRL